MHRNRFLTLTVSAYSNNKRIILQLEVLLYLIVRVRRIVSKTGRRSCRHLWGPVYLCTTTRCTANLRIGEPCDQNLGQNNSSPMWTAMISVFTYRCGHTKLDTRSSRRSGNSKLEYRTHSSTYHLRGVAANLTPRL